MERLFQPGDKVQLKTGGPVMEAVGYLLNDNFSHPSQASSGYVDCFYYDAFRGKWKRDFFHENSLKKIETSAPVWAENMKHLFSARVPAVLN